MVGKRIKENSVESGKSAVQRLLEPGFIDRVVDGPGRVAFSVEETPIDEPLMRQLDCGADNIAQGSSDDILTPGPELALELAIWS